MLESIKAAFKLGNVAAFQAIFTGVDKSDAGLAKAFANVDADSSGKISKIEMRAHIVSTYGGPLDEAMFKEMFTSADTDSDGKLSLEEFKAIMRAGPDSKPKPSNEQWWTAPPPTFKEEGWWTMKTVTHRDLTDKEAEDLIYNSGTGYYDIFEEVSDKVTRQPGGPEKFDGKPGSRNLTALAWLDLAAANDPKLGAVLAKYAKGGGKVFKEAPSFKGPYELSGYAAKYAYGGYPYA